MQCCRPRYLLFTDDKWHVYAKNIEVDCAYVWLCSPMLLATAAEQFGYTLMYPEYLGGSVAFSWSHFSQINGYPNRYILIFWKINIQNLKPFFEKRYWGWGGEDDDLFKRVKFKNLTINYLDSTIGRFKVRTFSQFIMHVNCMQ